MNKKIQRKARTLMYWLNLTRDDVLSMFMTMPGSIMVGKDDERFVYVRGMRENKVILVSHADSVWGDKKLKIKFDNGKYYSGESGIGIAADDRAGCAALWRLRATGHSLLITAREEGGCVGAKYLVKQKEYLEEINSKHQFAIEIDRKNERDLVFYDVFTKDFVDWCELNFKGYKMAQGSSTDIKHICEKICGVNISAGYLSEHSDKETLRVEAWLNTLETIRTVLSLQDIPKFELKQKNYSSYTGSSWNNSSQYTQTSYQSDKKAHENRYEDAILCPNCMIMIDVSEITIIPSKKCNDKTKACPMCGSIL